MSSNELLRDVGQLLWVGFEGASAPAELCARLAAGEAGGVILFRRNLAFTGDAVDLAALAALTEALHAASPADGPPVLLSVDHEGGRVQRVRAPATVWPPMLRLDDVGDDGTLAEAIGAALGAEVAALGFDVDFAPVLDVHTNPANPIIGDRAFGRDPETVSARALAFARGLARAGVIACGKHFPGHGDTDTDSHLELPRLSHDLDRLRAVELVPFARAAAAGIPMLMTAHVVFEALDPGVPATLSRRVLTGLLREELGYRGVIVSDDLDMKAIADHYGAAHAAVEAIAAGCDVLLCCRDPDTQRAASEALVRAGTDDVVMRERIAAAAARVRALKTAHAASPPARRTGAIGAADHAALAARLAGH